MTAPDRPMAGAFAALRLCDGLPVKDGFEFVETGGAAPTRSGAAISSNRWRCDQSLARHQLPLGPIKPQIGDGLPPCLREQGSGGFAV